MATAVPVIAVCRRRQRKSWIFCWSWLSGIFFPRAYMGSFYCSTTLEASAVILTTRYELLLRLTFLFLYLHFNTRLSKMSLVAIGRYKVRLYIFLVVSRGPFWVPRLLIYLHKKVVTKKWWCIGAREFRSCISMGWRLVFRALWPLMVSTCAQIMRPLWCWKGHKRPL